jgi:alpha-beta hydrolase superfamily lysophospholipase
MEFPGCHDCTLFAQAWLPERDARAVLVIAHGLAEHGGRYSGLAARLVAQGYAVYAPDQRGHGRSAGRRAAVERFDYLVSDLGTFIGRAQREHPGAPAFLVGHSMGGAVALACALRYHSSLRGLVLSAPLLAVVPEPSGVRLATLRLLASMAPNVGALTLPAAAISRDPEVVRAYENDPLVYRGRIPARTVAELLQATSSLRRRAHELRLPVLVQHGSADSLVSLEATHPVYQHLGVAKQRTLLVYEGLYHEIYNEPERERVIGDLVTWLGS